MTERGTAHLDYETYRRLLIEAAVDLADRERQIALWGVRGYRSTPDELSTPIEMAAAFVDDAYARDFLTQHHSRLTSEQVHSANELIHALTNLPDIVLDAPPNQTIDSHEWQDIRRLAGDFLVAWRHS